MRLLNCHILTPCANAENDEFKGILKALERREHGLSLGILMTLLLLMFCGERAARCDLLAISRAAIWTALRRDDEQLLVASQ